MTVKEFLDITLDTMVIAIWDYDAITNIDGGDVFCGWQNEETVEQYWNCNIDSFNYKNDKTYGQVICLNISSDNY